MAKSFLTSINLNNQSLLNARVDGRWGSAPTGTTNPDGNGTALAGQISYYSSYVYVFTGSAWVQVGTQFTGGTLTSNLKLAVGTASAGTAPLTFQSGTNLSSPAAGAMEYDGTNLYFTPASTRKTVAFTDSNVASATLAANLSTAYGSTPQVLQQSGANTTSLIAAGTTGQALVQGASSVAFSSALTGVTSLGTLTGLSMSGNIAMGTNFITGLKDPVNPQDAATKNYVDTSAQGLNVHDNVYVATTAALAATYAAGSTLGGDGGYGTGATLTMNANGVLTIDGYTFVTGDVSTRVLIKDQNTTFTITSTTNTGGNAQFNATGHGLAIGQAVKISGTTAGNYDGQYWVATTNFSANSFSVLTSQYNTGSLLPYASASTGSALAYGFSNGIYTVTQVGTASLPTIFTRAYDADNSSPGDITSGDLVFVANGAVNGQVQFVQNLNGTATTPAKGIKIGTDSINYALFASAGTYSAGTNINILSKVISVNTSPDFSGGTTTLGAVTLSGSPTLSGLATFANAITFTNSVVTANLNASAVSSNPIIYNSITTGSITIGNALTSGSINIGNGTAVGTGSINIGSGASGNANINIGAGNGTTGLATIAIGNNGQSGTNKSVTTIAGTVKLPQVQTGTAGFVKIATDGTLSTDVNTYLTSSSGVTTVTGTTGQVLVNGAVTATSGAITLTLPQSIATTSTPTFAGLTIGTSNIVGSAALTISAAANSNMIVSATGTGNAYLDSASTGSVYVGAATSGINIGNIVTANPIYLIHGASNFVQVGSSGNPGKIQTVPGATTVASGALTLQSGNQTGTAVTGSVTIQSGNASGANSGNIVIDAGTATGNTPGTVSVGATNATSVTIGKSAGSVTINGTLTAAAPAGSLTGTTLASGVVSSSLTKVGALSSGTAGFVKVDSSGNLTSDNSAYLTSASAVSAGFTKKASGTITLVAATQYTINHNLGSQLVATQIFDSTYTMVEVDVLNFDNNNVKVTSSLGGTFYYVIIG